MAPAQAPFAETQTTGSTFGGLAAAQEHVSILYRERTGVGSVPPQPATLRGKVGAVLVRGVRRTLFWLIPQMDAFNRAVVESTRLQLSALAEVASAAGTQAATVNRTVEELRQIQFEVRSKLESLGGEFQGIRDLLIELGLLMEQTVEEVEGKIQESLSTHARECGQIRKSETDQLKLGEESRGRGFEELRAGVAELRDLHFSARQELEMRVDQALEYCKAAAERLSAAFDRETPGTRPQPESVQVGLALRELETQVLWLKTQVAWQDQRIAALLEEQRNRWPQSSNGRLLVLTPEDRHRFEAFAADLQAEMRGSPKESIEGLKVYLPLLTEAQVGGFAMPVLDLGCGRGEWLELLRQEGIVGQGVDHNRVLIESCLNRGLQVVAADAFEYLFSLPASSLGALTALHFVEYLSPEQLMILFDQAVRVLKPGGLIIFETPNPANPVVSAGGFYADITRRRPVPARALRFLAEMKGFSEVRIMSLRPHCTENGQVTTDNDEESVNRDAQEYAVIGRKL